MSNFELKSKYLIEGKITLLSGLFIGGSFSPMSIGSPDNTVVRDPISGKPYIPGSSLKGKMRSLIEQSDGTLGNTSMDNVKFGPSLNPEHRSAQLFGLADKKEARPSRLIVRDGKIQQEDHFFENTDLPFTETKTEVVLDRISSAAVPRQIERVPAGAEFSLQLVLNVFEGQANGVADVAKDYLQTIWQALQMLQDDYLGGNGSRGSGQIDISIDQVRLRDQAYYRGENAEKQLSFAECWMPADLQAQNEAS